MSSRQLSQAQPYWSNSLAIRQEIQRFESVHPSIYAIYDLIESIPDALLGQQIRDHVVCIEDSFVNSQEWTLSRSVPDLRLGIVGSLSSGKSALVHRYLTGTYMQEESPEGGRFKKEISIDGQSYLLLIRDEGGPPELQFSAWVDAVIFVFSLENESSFNAVYNYYSKMTQFRNAAEVPIILVGTQDSINENNPRVVDESRARKLAAELRRCPYYETCATYGVNVDRVFQDACQRIIQLRLSTNPNAPRPTTPNHHTMGRHYSSAVTPVGSSHYPGHGFNPAGIPAVVAGSTVGPVVGIIGTGHSGITGFNGGLGGSTHNLHVASNGASARSVMPPPSHTPYANQYQGKPGGGGASSRRANAPPPPQSAPPSVNVERNSMTSQSTQSSNMMGSVESLTMRSTPPASSADTLNVPGGKEGKDLPTPTSTPTTTRKSRRRSNLFTPSSKKDEKDKDKDKNKSAGELGSGRAIPIKQGYLYKRSHKALNKDWKKKYVTLCDDGRLTYHSSLHDYMDDSHGKEISLQYVTVKVPGQKPRGSRTTQLTNPAPQPGIPANGINDALTTMSISAYEVLKEPVGRLLGNEDAANLNGDKNETPNVKKRHRRMKSSGNKANDLEDAEGYEFQIVSLDNKAWHFEAMSLEEREEWVSAIEQQILNTLQGNESSKSKSRMNSLVDAASIQSLRSSVAGNNRCADCDAPNPDWASLNLGILVCIECSGIHRNLGSHISRVRSLDLDEWPPGHIAVMLGLGNSISNSIWEARVKGAKPNPQSSREEKERWIRAKYEHKEFIQYPSNSVPLGQQLVDAVCSSDLKTVALLLAHAGPEDVNCSVGGRDLRTPLHLASALGNLALVQLLLWHSANVKALDHEGRTCLSFARASQSSEVIELLLSNGCPDGGSSALGSVSTLNRRKTVTVSGPSLASSSTNPGREQGF